ncbi:hypothetical protein [Zavarzinia sp. CC-PAN008]|uniref:hypothetical protein n=1 Tax=Zavarzinia sp. CC-PAN008 TaxID=3243332 RepID=UPI003F745A3E
MNRADTYATPPNPTTPQAAVMHGALPHTHEDPAKLNPTEARQGVKVGAMRYVLGISVAMAVLVLAAIFFIGP